MMWQNLHLTAILNNKACLDKEDFGVFFFLITCGSDGRTVGTGVHFTKGGGGVVKGLITQER